MHLLMALLLLWAALTIIGLPSSSHVCVGSFEKWKGHQENAAQLAGVKLGDQIVAVNGTLISSDSPLINIVSHDFGTRLTLLINRAGRDLTLHATPVDGTTINFTGKP